MPDALKAVRETVNHHKLQAQINEAFAEHLRATNTFRHDYSEQDLILFQLACAMGYRIGLREAQSALTDEQTRILERT
jgi:hypothetical protein